MPYQLGNQINLGIYVEGFELPIDGYMSVLKLHIGSTLGMKLPVMVLQISDAWGVFDAVPMVKDATRIQVRIAAGADEPELYTFRLFNHGKVPDSSGGNTWTIEGYLDSPMWWAGTSLRHYVGTSNDVLAQIAATCGVEFNGDQTSDSQVWNQQNRRYADFARYVAQHGFKTDTSRMTMAYDLSNRLIYKDVNTPQAPLMTIVNGQFQNGCAFATHYEAESISGYTNQNMGYQSTLYRQSLFKPSQVDTLAWTPNVTDPNFNSDVRKTIQTGKPRHSKIDVGNSSENKERAKFQNARYAQMFNQKLHLSSDYLPLPFPLLSWLNCNLYSERTGYPDVQNSGVYLVTARSILVKGTYFQDKIQCERHGVNSSEK